MHFSITDKFYYHFLLTQFEDIMIKTLSSHVYRHFVLNSRK